MKIYPLLIFGILLFLIFIVFSYMVHEDLFTRIDFDTTVKLQDNIPRKIDNFFSFFSDIGVFEVSTITLAVFLLFRRKVIAGSITFFLYFLFHIIELFGKFFVDHPPPPQFMLRTNHLMEFPQFHVRAEYSYPSGHSGRTVFLAGLILIYIWYTKKLPIWSKLLFTALISAFVIIMVLSRVYLGEHWASDVIGGTILGAGLALIGSSFYYIFTPAKQ